MVFPIIYGWWLRAVWKEQKGRAPVTLVLDWKEYDETTIGERMFRERERERVRGGARERGRGGGDESKEKGNKLMVSENAGMETKGRWRNLLENDQQIYLVRVVFIFVVDRSFVNYYSLFAVILLVE